MTVFDNNINPAYLAGVIDSDGSLSITIRHNKRPNPSYQAVFQLTWSFNPKTLTFFNKLVNTYGGSYFLQKVPRKTYKNSNPTIKYFITGKGLYKLLQDTRSYLQLKYEQADNLIKLIDTTELGKYGNKRPKPETLKQLHYNLYLQNKLLNTKNSGCRRLYDSN